MLTSADTVKPTSTFSNRSLSALKPLLNLEAIRFEKARRQQALDAQFQAKEIERCRADPTYFTRQYVWIEDLDTRQWIPFDLWPAQADALAEFRANKRCCVLKARQQGFSWIALADALHEMTFQPIASVLIFSKTDREAMNMVGSRLIGMWQRLPAWMRPDADGRPSAHAFEFTNGSRALSFPTNAGQSYSGTLAILDECDKIEGIDPL